MRWSGNRGHVEGLKNVHRNSPKKLTKKTCNRTKDSATQLAKNQGGRRNCPCL